MATGAGAEVTIDLREHRLRRHLPAGRTLHLVDLENLAGGSSASPAEIAAALSSYERTVRFAPGDHRVVACGKGLVYPVKDRWPGALVKFARGIDGADRLLLAAAEPAYVAAHYDRVVVAGGDHVFADLVAALGARGVDVCVVSLRSALSRRLEAVAPVVWHIELDGHVVRAA
jgi:hypothetical protein